MYEISYNADIIDNTFIDNAIVGGEGNKDFPTGAIYISESGGNASIPSRYAGSSTSRATSSRTTGPGS